MLHTQKSKTYATLKHEAKKNTAGGQEPSWRACHASQHQCSASLVCFLHFTLHSGVQLIYFITSLLVSGAEIAPIVCHCSVCVVLSFAIYNFFLRCSLYLYSVVLCFRSSVRYVLLRGGEICCLIWFCLSRSSPSLFTW